MGEVLSTVVKELSCHDCARYILNDASLHSRFCDKDECCECSAEAHLVKPPDEDPELDMEIDSPGCCDVEGLCCFAHASKK